MLPEKLIEVLKHEGVVTIVSWSEGEPHVVNTWNSYIVVTEDQRLLIPAYAMRKTERNVQANAKVKLALGARAVEGYKAYPGTGFVIEGTAGFIASGAEYDDMKERFSFLTRVLEIRDMTATQML